MLVRISEIPRYVALCLLLYPALFFSDTTTTTNNTYYYNDEYINIPTTTTTPIPITSYLIVAILSGIGSPLYFYDYIYLYRYITAIIVSWSISGVLLMVSFHISNSMLEDGNDNSDDGNDSLLLLFLSILGSFLVGITMFCIIRNNIDNIDRTRSLLVSLPYDDDVYTIPKVTYWFGWVVYVLSIFIYILCKSVKNKTSDRSQSLNYYTYSIIGLICSILVSINQPTIDYIVPYILSMPIGSVGSIYLASSELKKEGGDLSFFVFFLSLVGLLPGVAIFYIVHKIILRIIRQQEQMLSDCSQEDDEENNNNNMTMLSQLQLQLQQQQNRKNKSDYECIDVEDRELGDNNIIIIIESTPHPTNNNPIVTTAVIL